MQYLFRLVYTEYLNRWFNRCMTSIFNEYIYSLNEIYQIISCYNIIILLGNLFIYLFY